MIERLRMTIGHPLGMRTAKITVSLNQDLLRNLDPLVKSHVFRSRSQAVQEAVEEQMDHLSKTRLARGCAKLDPREEQAMADLGLAAESDQRPQY